jgi:hypothetical protein
MAACQLVWLLFQLVQVKVTCPSQRSLVEAKTACPSLGCLSTCPSQGCFVRDCLSGLFVNDCLSKARLFVQGKAVCPRQGCLSKQRLVQVKTAYQARLSMTACPSQCYLSMSCLSMATFCVKPHRAKEAAHQQRFCQRIDENHHFSHQMGSRSSAVRPYALNHDL